MIEAVTNYAQNNIAICLYLLKELFNGKSQ